MFRYFLNIILLQHVILTVINYYYFFSKSLLELLNLIDSIVAEISTAPESSIWRYHNILNSIIIIYCDMVEYQHSKTPEFQPQQSGVYIILFYYKNFHVK